MRDALLAAWVRQYAVVFCPDDAVERRLGRYFCSGADEATLGDGGWKVRRPAGGLRTEFFSVQRRPAEEGQVGTFCACTQGGYFESAPVCVWLPNELFAGKRIPDQMRLSRDAEGARSVCLARRRIDTVRTPLRLLELMSDGALFLGPATDVAGELPRLHFEPRRTGDGMGDKESLRGVLNPWVASATFGHGEAEVFRTAGVVDVHVDVRPSEWLRMRLHLALLYRWCDWIANRGDGVQMPVIPRLLFGGDGRPADRARAAVVVDALEGTFHVDWSTGPVGETGRRSARAGVRAQVTWRSRHLHSRDYLAQGALKTLSNGGWAVATPCSDEADGPATEGGDRVDAQAMASGLDADADATENHDLAEVLGAVFDGVAPTTLAPLGEFRDRAVNITEFEAKIVERLVRDRPVGGREVEAAIERFCYHLKPRSGIRIAYPPPPDGEGARWTGGDGKFDPLSRVTTGDNPRRAAIWWLRLIQPGREAVPGRWEFWNPWWKRHFRVALFRESSVGGWNDPPRPSAELGRAEVGELELGSQGVSVSSPADSWPQSIEY